MEAEALPTRQTARTGAALVEADAALPEREAEIDEVRQRYAVAVTPPMLDLIDPADTDDPVARQFVPRREELIVTTEERGDPIGDEPHTKLPGITHRYPDRLLLKPLHVCPVYCRFCFRREYVGPGGQMLKPEELERALGYIREHTEVWEVILTGGDPLVLSPRRLAHIMSGLADIDHVEIVRIHTRVPVVDPERVTDELVDALRRHTPTYVVLHSNHAREMTSAASEACARLVDGGIPMLSQSVLLRGVNDDPATLEHLFRTLVRNRVKPYYLHHGDLAHGTSHFRTSIAEGQALMRALRGDVSGICQPTYVLDIPGGHGKSPVGPNYLQPQPDDTWTVEDFRGHRHAYPPSVGPSAVRLDASTLRERFRSGPSVIQAPEPILSAPEAFALAVAAGEAHVAGTAASEVKLYVDGVQVVDRAADLLPRTSDVDARGYERRLRRDTGARSFMFYASAAHAYSPQLLDAGRWVLAALDASVTSGWAEFELFVGRYGVTPAGIHVEDCSNVHFVIDGDKTMHVWPPDHWNPEIAGGKTVEQAASSGHREHYLSDVDPAAHLTEALSLRGRGGDVLCWPAGHWHVGQADDVSIALNLAVYPSSDVAGGLHMAEAVVQ